MSHQVEIFRFTLGLGQSIGPAQLQALWTRACQTPQVSVGRRPGAYGSDKPAYSLYARSDIADVPLIEQRLRQLLELSQLRASLIALPRR